MRRTMTTFLSAAVLAMSAGVAHAADSSTLGSIALRPTIASISVEASLAGDDDGDATMELWVRKTGEPDFVQAHPLVRAGARGLGSVMFLDPSTGYDVKVVLQDPDNTGPLDAAQSATTRDDAPPPSTGGHLYVDAATGADTNDGSQTSPFATIQAAVNAASAGTTIEVAAGLYREAVTIDETHGGASGNPLRIVGAQGAIVDGSDPALEDGSAFVDEGGGVWSAPFQDDCRYAAVDDVRIYDYPSLAELQSGTTGIDGGFFWDEPAGRIYLRVPGGGAPTGHAIHVARLGAGFLLDTVGDVVIEGFEIRYFGSTEYSGVGVDVRDTSRSWVRNNVIHHMNEGVRIRRPMASDNVIEGNTVRDTSVWTWPWDAVKAHTAEASAISVTGGGGNVVRRNVLQGTFNGVYVGTFGDSSESIAPHTDVYENVLSQHGDDALEPEGACVNARFWSNAIHGVHNGLSLAPIEVGPLFFVRNLIEGYKAHALKINNGSQGWMLIYHTTSVPAELADAQALSPTEPFQHMLMRNNIWTAHRYVIESSITPSGPIDWDFDNLHTDSLDGEPRFVKWLDVRYANLAELQASNTIEQHGFDVVPAYEDAANGDFTPVEGNGLLDVGQVLPGINDRFTVGAGPDLGAFERGGVAPGNDAGVPDGSAGAAGSGGSGGSGGNTEGGVDPDGGAGDAAAGQGGAPSGDYPGEPVDDGSCGCRAAGSSPTSRAIGWLIAGLVAACASRCRARRSNS